MQSYAQTVARLRSMAFLLEEALRIADEGGNALVGAKISDCVDWIEQELTSVNVRAALHPITEQGSADPA
ncbi:conserved hypothetical protein [Sphingomonas sp. T1]|jgi:hypothetical protein|uniref:Uncharacterized protein n=2 Tax=Sphingomonadaceae TaxID=41297 RepID=A0A2T4YLG9_9SPHN|nr:hypothetical protein [Sphingomonas sp. Ant20]KHA64738.1 hypothetical protein NI18_07005 [Sphingomonas sp. Ant20]PTM44110.1 hypothetical protein C8J24_3383 [Sphingomonas aerolata]VXC84305.1 conserved hypothetical protein [Sphingomonas sp. T1]